MTRGILGDFVNPLALRSSALAVAEDAAKDNVEDIALLFLDGVVAEEIVREHRAVHQIADRIEECVDLEVGAEAAVVDEFLIERSPMDASLVAMFKVRWPLAVLKDCPFLDEQFHKMRVLGEERQVRSNCAADPFKRLVRAFFGFADGVLHLVHAPIDAREEQLFFAFEVEVNRSLGDSQPRRNAVHVAIRVTALSKQLAGGLDNFLTAQRTLIRRLRSTRLAKCFHDVSPADWAIREPKDRLPLDTSMIDRNIMTDQSVILGKAKS